MKQFDTNNGHLLVLERGEELLTSLNTFAKQTKLNSAWLSGLGGSSNLTIGFYDLKTKDYSWQSYDEPLEIISLSGNLSIVDGEPFWHIHGSFSNSDYQTFSGHVKNLTISLTGEIMITHLDTPLTRSYDAETGLKLLDAAS